MIARVTRIVSVVSVLLFAATQAGAQGWKPERNVELIVPASAGGSLDTTGRTVQRLWDELKLLPVSSTVVNRAGGGHAVAYNFLNQRAGDPHYMSITSSTLHTSNINGRTPLSYRDFTPLTVLLTEYIAFAVRADSPIRNGKDLIEALRKNPASMSLALSSAVGGTHHISFGLPLQSAKVDMTQTKLVAFNSTAEAVTALLGGHVDVNFETAITARAAIQSGRVRALAVTSPKPSPSYPDLPTIAATGVPGYAAVPWYTIATARGVPDQVVAKLNADINRVLQSPALAARWEKQGLAPVGGTPQQAEERNKVETRRWEAVIDAARIQVE